MTVTGGDAESDVRIGDRLRQARLARRLTLAELAEASGLTKGFISKLERDRANTSVAALIRICDALGIRPGELFDAPSGQVVRRDAYPPINFGGNDMTEYLLTPRGERRIQAILSIVRPGGGSGQEAYELPVDVEFALVLDGSLEVDVDGETVTLGTGDALTFPANNTHAFRNHTRQAARVLWVFSPALSDKLSQD